MKSSVKRLYACSLHFSAEFIYGKRVSNFAVPKCAQLNELFREKPIPSFNEGSEIKIGNQGDNILEEIIMDTEKSFSFSETPSQSNSDVRTLKATLDHYRSQYLLEKRLRSKLKVANVLLSREVEKYKRKVENLELQLKKKNDISSKISKPLLVCLENGLTNYTREPKQRRYSVGLKLISLAVLFLSPLVYRYLSPMLNWPQIRTLQHFVKDWPKAPGNLNGTFEALRVRAQDFTDEDKFVSVSCDEMSLKTFLDYDRFKDKIIGLQDFGDENRSRNLATSAMVIMASGIGGQSWSQAISYFVYGNCRGLTMKTYIFEAISKLQAIGLKPCQFVCDQGDNFVNFSKIVGVTLERPYFVVSGKRNFCLFVRCQALKARLVWIMKGPS